MSGVRYLSAFAVGTVVGVINEYIQKPYQPCYQDPKFSHFLTCGSANVYGWGLLGLTLYMDAMFAIRLPTILVVLSIGPVLSLLEGVMGGVSRWYFGEKRWDYPEKYYPMLGGTVSLVSGAYFAIGGILFWGLLYKPIISKI